MSVPASSAAPSAMSARPQVRRIACVGFDWRAEVSLKETLALLHGKTLDRWQYSDEPGADVLVYDSSNALAQAIVRRSGADGGARICFPSASDDAQALTLRYPFGASRLIRCLDHASQQLAGSASAATTPRTSLCQRLDEALRTPGAIAVVIEAGERIGVLRPADGRLLWPTAMGLDETAQLLVGEVELRVLIAADRERLRRIEMQAPVEQPAEPLLWAIGITRSGGTPLRRLEAGSRWRLRRWPDFGVLGRRSSELRCTALLTQRALSLAELSSLAGLPAAVAGAFLNASALCGLLDDGDGRAALAAPAAVAAADSRFGGVLRRIRVALALG